jgi:molybdopterin molybdotransferase
VTKYEETDYTDASVTIFEPFTPDSNIAHAGEDIKSGQTVAGRGSVIEPPLIGIFAALGIKSVDVIRRPTVAICSLGSELIEAEEPLLPGKIRNSNLHTFSSYLKADGLTPLEFGIMPDDAGRIADVIKQGVSLADVFITTGGVSVGDYDFVCSALKSVGAEILFWKMDIKPGASILVSKVDGKLVLSLSGNPAAAAIGYKLIGVPCLRKMMGYINPGPALFKLKLLDPVKKPSPRMRVLPGALKIVDGEAHFKQHGVKGNGVLSSMIGCDLLGVIPAGSPPLAAGDTIEAFIYQF